MISIADEPTMVYRFRDGFHVPQGVTVEGILDERERVVQRYGAATAGLSAQAILEDEEHFPNLRAWGPTDPESAFRTAMEEGVRKAYGSIVIVRDEKVSHGKHETFEVRLLHAVPCGIAAELSYEPIEVVRQDPDRKKWLLRQLRRDAAVFADRLKNALAELEDLS